MHWQLVLFAALAVDAGKLSGGIANVRKPHAHGPFVAGAAKGTAVAEGTGIARARPTGIGLSGPVKYTSTGAVNARYSPPPGKWIAITAHPDGQCQHSLSKKSPTYYVKDSFPKFSTIDSADFPGAESKSGGGYDIWWNIADPGVGCRVQVMLPYEESAGTKGFPGGIEMINAGSAGCYFGNVPTNSKVLLSYCCGEKDCKASSLGSDLLLAKPHKKREVLEPPSKTPEAEAETDDAIAAPSDSLAAPAYHDLAHHRLAHRSSSLDARAHHRRFYYSPPPKPKKNGTCVFSVGETYSQAGAQVIVSSSQSCPDTSCSVSISSQVSYSTTAASSTDQTISGSVGGSVTVTSGEEMIEKFSVGVTATWGFSDAISKSTGTWIAVNNATTITASLSIKLGNLGAVSFTPVYKCYVGPLECGGPKSDPITVCQPQILSTGGAPNGQFNAVTFG